MNRLSSAISVALLIYPFGFRSAAAIPIQDIPRVRTVGICSGSTELAESIYDDWSQAVSKLSEGQKLINQNGKLAKIAKTVGEAHVLFGKASRARKILELMGEPCSIDLEFRLLELRTQQNKILFSDTAKRLAPVADREFDRNRTRIRKQLEEVKKLVGSQSLLEAEAKLNSVYEFVDGFGFFLKPAKRQTLYGEVFGLSDEKILHERLSRQRLTKYQSELVDSFNRQMPDLRELQTEIAMASSQILEKGTADIDGQSCNGPVSFGKLFQKCKEANARLIRCHGIAASYDVTSEEPILVERTINRMDRLKSDILVMLAKIIFNDADQISKGNVRRHYMQYLENISAAAVEMPGDFLFNACNESLPDLVAKDESLNEEVTAYQTAMDGLLAWKNKVARQKSESFRKQFPPANFVLTKQLDGYLGPAESIDSPTVLRQSLVGLAQPGIEALADRTVTLSQVVHQGEYSFTPVSGRYWSRSKIPVESSKPFVEKLNEDLMTSTSQPPLSLSAAVALRSADRHQFENMGAKILSGRFESACQRFATMPANGAIIVPYGGDYNKLEINQILVRLDVQPSWYQHSHFFVDLSETK